MIPTIAGPTNPGVVDILLLMPIIVPPYFGAMSIGFTMNPLNAKPKKATLTQRRTIVDSEDST